MARRILVIDQCDRCRASQMDSSMQSCLVRLGNERREVIVCESCFEESRVALSWALDLPSKSDPHKLPHATTTAPADRAGEIHMAGGYRVREGSDTHLIVRTLLTGGANREHINRVIETELIKRNAMLTREGNTKNIPSLVSGMLKRLTDFGYREDSHYIVLPSD